MLATLIMPHEFHSAEKGLLIQSLFFEREVEVGQRASQLLSCVCCY